MQEQRDGASATTPCWCTGLKFDPAQLASLPEAARGSISLGASLVNSVNVGDVLVNLATASRTLVDARAADRFRGENETMDPIGGHIPGAKNRFFKDNLQADGCFKSPQELQAEWSAIVPDASKAIMQCGSGVTACHNLLALRFRFYPISATVLTNLVDFRLSELYVSKWEVFIFNSY